ncbi:13780_t:CDS:2, partial [Funneliformis geosporum]
HYSNENYLVSILSCDELAMRNDKSLTSILKNEIVNHQDIPFMPINIEESKEHLINSQKVVITIISIKNILTTGNDNKGSTVNMSLFQKECIKAYPIYSYHTEKKLYLHIIISNKDQRFTAFNIISSYNSKIDSEYKIETALDNTDTYYRKVVREYQISLFGWELI